MRGIKKVIWIAIIGLVLTLCVSAQAVTKCDHTSNEAARFSNIAIRPPVNVVNYDGRTLSVVFRDKVGVYVEDYYTDKDSIINIPKDHKGRSFWVMIDLCDKPHPYLYIVTPLTPEQLKSK